MIKIDFFILKFFILIFYFFKFESLSQNLTS